MRVYHVVVLVNCALAAGALAGYVWRQSEVDALRNELNRARLEALERSRQPREWSVSGIVRGPQADRGALVITHEPIRGLMGAMTMTFSVADRSLLGVARVGERVRFTLIERNRDLIVVAVEREETGASSVQLP